MADRFEVELHSTHPDGVAATQATLDMLPGRGRLVEDAGRWFIEAPGPALGFLKFAVGAQGYVKRVVDDH